MRVVAARACAVLCFLGLVSFAEAVVQDGIAATSEPWRMAPGVSRWWIAGRVTASWAAWIVLAPAILAVLRRAPRPWRLRLPLYALLPVAAIPAHTVLYEVMLRALGIVNAIPLWAMFRMVMPWQIEEGILAYSSLLAVSILSDYAARAKWQERRESQQAALFAHAQLDALRLQLGPHFLFNTLHSVGGLVRHGRGPEAVRMITALSDMLRTLLAAPVDTVVPLADELTFVDRYLDLERIRFGDRLSVETDIAPETEGVRVPQFLLQPLVENAIKHGISPRADGGRVVIRARLQERILVVSVWNDFPNGVVDAADKPVGTGFGLATARARLLRHYGGDQQLTFERPAGGVLVTVRLPAHTGIHRPKDAA